MKLIETILLLCFCVNLTYSQTRLSISKEKDCILAMSAMAYVYKDWQEEYIAPSRGYNIGAILYDSKNDSIIALDKNSVRQYGDKTQHAEVRLMQGYMERGEKAYLDGMQIITTLEPCMMCSGMMMFLTVDTVKYIQADPEYGKNIERLAMDWTDEKGSVHPANERAIRIRSVQIELPFLGSILDTAYQKYRKNNPSKGMSEFLYTENARKIYAFWSDCIDMWVVENKENQRLLNHVRRILQLGTNVPTDIKDIHKRNVEKMKFLYKKHELNKI